MTLTDEEIRVKVAELLKRCQAARSDGECIHPQCPQNRDKEPQSTGRTCPLPWWDSDDE